MDIKQFETLKATIPDNIIGQFIGIVGVTNSQFSAQYKSMGYKKITRYNVQLTKKKFLDAVNTSTGAESMGVEFKSKRESFYEHEKLEFFEHLRSNPDKKYLRLVWDNDKHNTVKSVYVDPSGRVIGESVEAVKDFITPSAYKKATEGYGREKVMRDMGISVNENDIGIDSIAELKICGQHIIDAELNKYIDYVR
jgi:hypothetical protein